MTGGECGSWGKARGFLTRKVHRGPNSMGPGSPSFWYSQPLACLHELSLALIPSKQLIIFFCKCQQKGLGKNYRKKSFNNLTRGSVPLSRSRLEQGQADFSLVYCIYIIPTHPPSNSSHAYPQTFFLFILNFKFILHINHNSPSPPFSRSSPHPTSPLLSKPQKG